MNDLDITRTILDGAIDPPNHHNDDSSIIADYYDVAERRRRRQHELKQRARTIKYWQQHDSSRIAELKKLWRERDELIGTRCKYEYFCELCNHPFTTFVYRSERMKKHCNICARFIRQKRQRQYQRSIAQRRAAEPQEQKIPTVKIDPSMVRQPSTLSQRLEEDRAQHVADKQWRSFSQSLKTDWPVVAWTPETGLTHQDDNHQDDNSETLD